MFKIFRKLNRNILILGGVSFFTDVSSEMLYPINPIFLTSLVGVSMLGLGFIEGIAEATASILKVYSGYLSDRFRKRKPFIIAGYGLSSISKPLLGLSLIWPEALFARFLDRFGKGLRTSARDALISEYSKKEAQGLSFGFHRSMDTLGAVVGPLLAIGFLIILKDNLRLIYFLSFIPAAFAVVLTFIIKDVKKNLVGNVKRIKLRFSKLNPEYKKFLFVWSIFCIGNSSNVFLIMRAKTLGFSLVSLILVYVFYNCSYALFSLWGGILSDRFTKKQ